jgi:hypothetical protein
VPSYIERFNYPKRQHSMLGYLSPRESEQMQLAYLPVHGTGSSPRRGVVQQQYALRQKVQVRRWLGLRTSGIG